MLRSFCAILALGLPQYALADVTVQFRDGAPKDRFVISSDAGVCAEGAIRVEIDLTGSMGQLIFDVTGAGSGVEVFQPFELVAGGDIVLGASAVTDGDQAMALELSALMPGAEVAFTIDVDDTIGAREITVSGSEISGGVVRLIADGQTETGVFEADGIARINWPACLS